MTSISAQALETLKREIARENSELHKLENDKVKIEREIEKIRGELSHHESEVSTVQQELAKLLETKK